MLSRESFAQLVLTLGFLAVIFGVPIGQIVVELRRGVPVQSMDLFRHAPTKENLRRYERTLEDSWWGQTTLRPKMQRLLFESLHCMGAKVVAGREGWLFYRPGLQYLVEADRMEQDNSDSLWVESSNGVTCRDTVIDAITRFRDQLKVAGIELLVVPVPGKASVYPELVSRRAGDGRYQFRSPTEQLLKQLNARGVETVDLFSAFRVARKKATRRSENVPQNYARKYSRPRLDTSSGGFVTGGKNVSQDRIELMGQSGDASHVRRLGEGREEKTFYLARDTHWTPVGAKVAADAVSRKLRQLGWVPEQPFRYATKTVRVSRTGDIIEMMRVPGIRESFPSETVECMQVIDPFLDGPMVPAANGRAGIYVNDHLIDTPMEAMFLLLGDSFSRIYQLPEPASLGQVVDEARHVDAPRRHGTPRKRLLPGSAGFPALLAESLEAPVDLIVSDGGAATDVRQQLSVNPEILRNKKVVIWEFAERDVRLGSAGWKLVPLDVNQDGVGTP